MKALTCVPTNNVRYIREARVVDCIPGFTIRGSRADMEPVDVPVEEIEMWRMSNQAKHYIQVRAGSPTYELLQSRFPTNNEKEIVNTLMYEPYGRPQHDNDTRNSDHFIEKYVSFPFTPKQVTVGPDDVWTMPEVIDFMNLNLSSKLSERSKLQTIRETMADQGSDRVIVAISRELFNAVNVVPKWKKVNL